ncbi:MAG TPA: prephenate dehydrogenase/arogenate dehydrogenase family protein [Patescibacteria group bacterium]|nr:prephenate dehydrogenase/arogenate dehydrogenase family protein [Patescibacteria group bacterium]
MVNNSDLANLNITIIGLGLMGGSMAKVLHSTVHRIVAVDSDRRSLEIALAQGVISEGTMDLKSGVANADVIVLATPVSLILDILHKLPHLRPGGCLIMDLGSTKAEITNAMSDLPDSFEAIGGHPMCGRERSGYGASSSNLFDGQTFILCRSQRTTQSAEELAVNIVRAIHARPLFLDALLHDEVVASTSHLPYLVAALLTSRVAEEALVDKQYWQISATGLRDVSRLAGSNPQMMLDILKSNKKPVLEQLKSLHTEMNELILALEKNDLGAISTWLQGAWQHHDSYLKYRWVEPGEILSDDRDE